MLEGTEKTTHVLEVHCQTLAVQLPIEAPDDLTDVQIAERFFKQLREDGHVICEDPDSGDVHCFSAPDDKAVVSLHVYTLRAFKSMMNERKMAQQEQMQMQRFGGR